MIAQVLRVTWYRFRATLARRWTGYVSVVLLLGLVGGVAMAAVAGARRTESSFPTYLASTNPSTLALFSTYDAPNLDVTTGYRPRIARAIAHLPFVTRSTTSLIFDANIDIPAITGVHFNSSPGESPPSFVGSLNGEYSAVDRVTLLRGRFANPRRLDEAIMNVQAAKEGGLHVGSVVHIPFYSDAAVQSSAPGSPFITARIVIVGEFIASNAIVESDKDALGASAVIFSPALTKLLAPKCATGTETFLQLAGGDANAKRVLTAIYKVDPVAAQFPAELTSNFVPTAQQAISPEAIALGVFGGLAGLAALLISGLMFSRLVRIGEADIDRLRALGATRSMMLADQLAGALATLLLGAVAAVAVASALSPLAPIGPVRPVYPDRGINLDWTVLGLGFLVLTVVLGVLTVVFAKREIRNVTSRRIDTRWREEPRVLRSAAASGLAISILTGLRFALDPGHGRNTAPVRSAILGAVLAVAVLMATVTFGASLDNLVSHPPLYGWNWNYALLSSFSGAEDLPAHQTAALLNRDPYILSWSGMNVAKAKIDGQREEILVENPRARVAPPLLSGHGLDASNQIVLGPLTLAQLHKRIGETVTFNNGYKKPSRLLIVGTATMPAITGAGMGSGAITAPSVFPAALLNLQDATIPGPNVVLVRIRRHVNALTAVRSLDKVNSEINAIPAASGLAGGVISLLRPAEIVNFRSMGTTPAILAGSLAFGAIVALGLTLGASVRRRRRDLALLKALGFTQGQLAAAIAWQATVAAVIGCIVGLPVGVIVGRQLWTLFARSIYAIPDGVVPLWSVVVVGGGAVCFAVLMSLLPGRSAARTPAALVLRAE